ARFVGDEVEAGQAKGESLDDMAILVRASFQTRPFEDRFVTLGVPYRVVGGLRFYERAEVRDALAYLRVVNQPDDDLAFERILNVPKRGLGDAAVQRLHLAARGAGTSLYQAARGLVETDELKPKPRKALADLIAGFERWRAQTETLGHVEVAEMVLDESGYTGALQADKSIEAEGRLDNLKELVRAMAEFENLGGFLEHVALVMDNETESGEAKVSLMTLHAAKGLEFATVFLPGWEEGVFPNQRTLDEGGGSGLEEERRLAYVGLTRARRRAIVSFAANRRIHDRWQNNPPSRFIGELPAEHVEIVAARGLHAGASPVSGFDDAPSRVFRGSTWTNSPRIIEAKANRLPESGPRGRFKLGDRVRHGSFGLGKVVSVEGDKLGIAFEKGGAKKVMAAFVEPAT
ncbi:MAG: DNA helicase II, partial [Alphaproteobacteria bacterium]|nr:DNA helicase II [Alphaproteobacteria bacterium]